MIQEKGEKEIKKKNEIKRRRNSNKQKLMKLLCEKKERTDN